MPATAGNSPTETPRHVDFIRDIINEHLKTGRYTSVVTRFPPEPNGFLHIGHAKSICLNFGIAQEYGGVCHLRMDDTDPTKEDVMYVESIKNDVRWLGFDWNDKLFFASDYFETLYNYAVQLIQDGKAYVCSLNEEEIRAYRGTVTEPGRNSPYRDRAIQENLDLFERMRAGEFPDGAHVLRAKIDMASPNMKMRDPLLYRIRHVSHYRTGDKWCIYPMYDFAHCLSDYLEGITHSICTLEFENNRELYDWILDALNIPEPRPHQYEFARLNLNYTVMSKRKLLDLVEGGHVSGWDDPRLPTISGLRRRGYTPESVRKFCESIGVAKANSVVDMAQLEHSIRDDLNQKAPRVLCVLRPLRVVIENYPENQVEQLHAPYYPYDVPLEGYRMVPFSREIYIERDDFMENPPKNYYRLAPGQEVRLRHAYIIKCEKVIRDEQTGEIQELRCTYDPATRSGSGTSDRQVKGTIHWVSAPHAIPVEVRLYDRLFLEPHPEGGPESLNPHSLEVIKPAYIEASMKGTEPGSRFQFERLGYFCLDTVDSTPDNMVFNRIVQLRDTWAKITKAPEQDAKPAASDGQAPKAVKSKQPAATQPAPRQKPAKSGETELTPEQEARSRRYQETLGLALDDARILAANDELSRFFEAALTHHNNAQGLANWLINELLRELKERPLSDLPFGPEAFARLVALMDDETISSKIAKDVLEIMLADGGNPAEIVDQRGLRQVSDPAVIEPVVEKVIAANPDNVARYREGRTNLLGFFVGQVIKETGGKANPKLVNQLVLNRLSQL